MWENEFSPGKLTKFISQQAASQGAVMPDRYRWYKMLEIRNICNVQKTTTATGLAVLCLTGVWVSLLDWYPTNESIDRMRGKLEAYFLKKPRISPSQIKPWCTPSKSDGATGQPEITWLFFFVLHLFLRWQPIFMLLAKRESVRTDSQFKAVKCCIAVKYLI